MVSLVHLATCQHLLANPVVPKPRPWQSPVHGHLKWTLRKTCCLPDKLFGCSLLGIFERLWLFVMQPLDSHLYSMHNPVVKQQARALVLSNNHSAQGLVWHGLVVASLFN